MNTLFPEKRIAITGRLKYMTRRTAAAAIQNRGAIYCSSVTRATDYLVIGDNSYHRTAGEAGESRKMLRGRALQKRGVPVQFISEEDLLMLLWVDM